MKLQLYGLFKAALRFRGLPPLLLCAALLFGCDPMAAEKEAVRTTVAKYNYALVRAYKEANPDLLKPVATEAESIKVGAIITVYMGGFQIMDAELKKLEFKDIAVEDAKAVVGTSEDWTYMWINSKSGEVVVPRAARHYEMTYYLALKDGRWLVERVEDSTAKDDKK